MAVQNGTFQKVEEDSLPPWFGFLATIIQGDIYPPVLPLIDVLLYVGM
jgi:hypothetical protein